jgi:hypothetical protein
MFSFCYLKIRRGVPTRPKIPSLRSGNGAVCYPQHSRRCSWSRASVGNGAMEQSTFLALALSIHNKQSTSGGFFHFRRAAFPSGLKIKVGLALAKAAALRIVLNLDGPPIVFRSSSSTTNPVCASPVNLLVCSLPLHRHSYIGFIFNFHFIDS